MTFFFSVQGQIEFGVKAGLSTMDLTNNNILISGENNALDINLKNVGYGHHFGLYTRLTLLGIYAESALLFNSNTINYNITEYSENGIVNLVKNEKYNKLDVPVIAGIKLGILRLQGGIVGHLSLNKTSDLIDFGGYREKINAANYGWQAGIGIDFWRLRLDLNYEGNKSAFGNSVLVGGQEYSLANSPSRVLLTAGFKF